MPDNTSLNTLLQQYIPPHRSHNEIYEDDKSIRPDWELFFSSLSNLGENEIKARSQVILRLLKENGVAYNVYNDPSGESRPWELDTIPQLITAGEWKKINAGLIQRAELFNLLLKDIYGPQTLIKEGILPQELIYMHPGFIRSCVNIKVPAQQHLVMYAADMARGTDGRLWVISDRSQAPSGYGYALENRFAMNSVLPELFSGLQVSRLSPFFDSLQSALTNIAPHKKEDPRVVILTPGPDNETYFEHAYLAAYLGLTLVQGNDLMVKDNFVWLKTIEGLEKVDVILRRLDDIYCDPLELKSDSLLGVAGLLQVVRKGNVAIANPLGSSIIENAGLVPFLPSIARHFFGKDLLTPSIATWWCGQPKELQYVIDNIKHLVVRRIYRNVAGTRSAIDGASLTVEKIKELALEIKANPYLYVGQEKIHFSSTPSFVDGKIHAGHSLLRSFLVSSKDSFVAMPGGLTRTSYQANDFIISNQSGDISKDTWVLSDEENQLQPVKFQLITDSMQTLQTKRSLPSHTAENLFWVGRNTERVINNSRLQRTVMQYILQNNNSFKGENIATRDILLQAVTSCTYTYPGFATVDETEKKADLFTNPFAEFSDILYNDLRNGSLTNNLSMLKRSVYSVRNFWSLDTWRVLRQIDESWDTAKKTANTDHLGMIGTIDTLNIYMFAFLGMNRESVRREQGWNILDLGRKLEQAIYIVSLLRNIFQQKQNEQVEYELLDAVLIATQSRITYRYTYRDHLQLPLMLELLMLDMNYPQSLAYLVHKIKRYVSLLPKSGKNGLLSEHEKVILEADTLLKQTSSAKLSQADETSGEYTELQIFLDDLYGLLTHTSMLVSKTYFKHTLSQKQLFTANFS
ncbi:circularly permuted type 2 ATP-grasp protein [soil metagenome]